MEYKVIVDYTNADEEVEIFKGKSVYSDDNKEDDIKITNHEIEIRFCRKGDKNIKNMIRNNNSTINQQITKSLCYKYAYDSKKIVIKSIILEKYINGKIVDTYSIYELNQPFEEDIPSHIKFDLLSLKNMFSDYGKSQIIMISLVSLLKGINEELQGIKFEKYWKSFNSLYNGISSSNDEM